MTSTTTIPNVPAHAPTSIQTARLVGISKSDEDKMLELLKKNAMTKCHVEVKEFVDCVQEKGYGLPLCKPFAQKMNECVKQFSKVEDMDALRKQLLEEKLERRRQRLAQWKASQEAKK